MSFLATLQIHNTDIKKARVINVEFEFTQPVDHTFRPKGRVQAGLITIEIESSQNNTLAQWMISDSMQHSGEIAFEKSEGGSSLRNLQFHDAYCIYYKEIFNANDQNPMRIIVKLSARGIEINKLRLDNYWPEKTGTAYSPEDRNPHQSNEPIKSFNPLD